MRLFLAGSLAILAAAVPSLASTPGAPEFKEIYDLIRTNAAGLSDAELNRAAVQGLVTALGTKVSLASNDAAPDELASEPLVSQTNLFDSSIAYLRVTRVGEGLARELNGARQALGSTNKLKGLVLDLRYADGTDYAAAVAAVDLFAAKAEPLLNWGNGMVSSTGEALAPQPPVAVLVNRETARAAEALAAMLRKTAVGLILGGRTAGQAMVMRDFFLKDGRRLSIATAPITLGDGSVLSDEGIKPDIEVSVSPEDERAYYADAFATLPRPGTVSAGAQPGARRNRVNEAELVRAHREGMDRDANPDQPVQRPPARSAAPEKPLVNDPTLARALDLLRALAVVRSGQS
jgi:C-terminal processing protease CtpA/Prc